MTELKPCPFCGATPHLGSYNTNTDWKVRCRNDNCGCMPSTWLLDTKEEAIEAWNKRVGEQE